MIFFYWRVLFIIITSANSATWNHNVSEIIVCKFCFALFSKRKGKCAHIKHRDSVIWILTAPQRERRWETYLSISYSASPHRESQAWDCYYYAFLWLSQWLPMAWSLLFQIHCLSFDYITHEKTKASDWF